METLKIGITFDFIQFYLPNKRCRKKRSRRMTTCREIDVKKLTNDLFPVAFIVHHNRTDGDGDGEYKLCHDQIRAYMGKLYMIRRENDGKKTPIDHLNWALKTAAGYAYGSEDNGFIEGESVILSDDIDIRVSAMQEKASHYVIVGDTLWHEVGEPYYHTQTFGLGNNHGGTGFFVDYATDEDGIIPDYAFNANEYDEAMEDFKETALGRGDTKSVNVYKNGPYIEVVCPREAVMNHRRVRKDINLGSFSVDVVLQSNGLYDIWIAHSESTGTHHTDVPGNRIGQLLLDEIRDTEKYLLEGGAT